MTEAEEVGVVLLPNSWVAPDACTLPTVEQPMRVAEFERLFANHVTVVERDEPTLLVLILHGPPDLAAQVKELTDRESACCSFFDFTVSTDEPQDGTRLVRLEVAVPAARIEVLDALAEHANARRRPKPA